MNSQYFSLSGHDARDMRIWIGASILATMINVALALSITAVVHASLKDSLSPTDYAKVLLSFPKHIILAPVFLVLGSLSLTIHDAYLNKADLKCRRFWIGALLLFQVISVIVYWTIELKQLLLRR